MDLLTWLIVGLVAGILSTVVAGGIGYGIVGDIVVGIVGSFVGSWLFRQMGLASSFPGLVGIILIAFVGAVVLLLILLESFNFSVS
jgi:uncharacterized membrane protein YeaQ/YmgE (transglycosylase-associated protein family)